MDMVSAMPELGRFLHSASYSNWWRDSRLAKHHRRTSSKYDHLLRKMCFTPQVNVLYGLQCRACFLCHNVSAKLLSNVKRPQKN